MKSKDQILLEQAYQKIYEDMDNPFTRILAFLATMGIGLVGLKHATKDYSEGLPNKPTPSLEDSKYALESYVQDIYRCNVPVHEKHLKALQMIIDKVPDERIKNSAIKALHKQQNRDWNIGSVRGW